MLKKQIGAGFLSLAMLSGVGLHNAAFADPDPTTDYNIAVNDGDGYDYGNPTATFTDGVNQDTENSIDAVQPQSSASIRGYQTEEPEGYAVNVTWGDMVFVYDRGQFNPETGTFERATDVDGCAAGRDYFENVDGYIQPIQKVNAWYGFDGVNNRITCQNLSTGTVNVTPVASANTSTHPNVTCRLLKFMYNSGAEEKWNWDRTGQGYVECYHCGFKDVISDEFRGSWSSHSLGYIDGCAVTMYAKPRNADGSWVSDSWEESTANQSGAYPDYYYTGEQASFFLDITGEPANTLTTDSTDPAVIGSITLSFAKASE